MKPINLGPVTLNIIDTGPKSGTPLLFSNSLGTDYRVWDSFLEFLPKSFRVIRYDNRGHGLSSKSEKNFNIADLVEDVIRIINSLGLPKIVFIGLSIGGLVGQLLAIRRPDLLSALVLSGSAAKIGDKDIWNERIETISVSGIESLREPILKKWFTAGFSTTRWEEFELWGNMLTRTDREGYIECCKAIADFDSTEEISSIKTPTLMLVGDADGSTPPALVKHTAELISNSHLEIIKNAGHLPCVEQPEKTAFLVRTFLERYGIT